MLKSKKKLLVAAIVALNFLAVFVCGVLARTDAPIIFQNVPQERFAGCHGTVTLSLTASEATTEAVFVGGLPLGRIHNNSGGALTISIYDALTLSGTANVMYDEDGVQVGPITVPNGASYQMPSGAVGMTWCVLVLSTGTADVTVSFGR